MKKNIKNLVIKGNQRNPTINFDAQKGVLEICGRSTTENSIAFYQPIYEWIDSYNESPPMCTIVNFKLEYFNTSTSRWIFKILKKLEQTHEKTNSVLINWHFSDDDILDSGRDFDSIIKIPFKMVNCK